MSGALYSMKTVAEAAGIAYETVRYYCKIGLVPRVTRDVNNYRIFDEHDLAWLKGLQCLRQCGMGIEQMRHYMELCLQGESSIPERQEIMAMQREEVEERIAVLQEMLDYIDNKQRFYAGVLAGKIPYYSNLLEPTQPRQLKSSTKTTEA